MAPRSSARRFIQKTRSLLSSAAARDLLFAELPSAANMFLKAKSALSAAKPKILNAVLV